MTAVPAVTTFSDAAATSASAVYANDVALAGAFGALDTTNSISNDNAPMLIGPIRVIVSSAATLYRWEVPSDFELWELHVSPQPAVDGGTSGATLDNDNWRQIGVKNNGVNLGAPFAEPKSATVSYIMDMSSASNRVVSDGNEIEIFSTGGAGSPSYHSCISVLGYTKHRS
tara:strand:+ start:740 stop:1252 length:513 start_codon:yes stop_codon:yes gene_type:complete